MTDKEETSLNLLYIPSYSGNFGCRQNMLTIFQHVRHMRIFKSLLMASMYTLIDTHGPTVTKLHFSRYRVTLAYTSSFPINQVTRSFIFPLVRKLASLLYH